MSDKSPRIGTPSMLMRTQFAAVGLFSLLVPGCSRPTVVSAARASAAGSPAIVRVTTVTPERMTLRRTTEQPGQIEAVETTPIYAKLGGYVERVAADIGDQVKKGQILAELRMPETEADVKHKRALIARAQAEEKYAEVIVEVSRAGVTTAEAKVTEVQAGIRRAEADRARWRAEFTRIEQLFRERAQTGSLLDETRNKLEAAEATELEVRARVKSAEAALAEAKALLDKARSDVETAKSQIEVARFESEGAEAMASYMKILAPFDGVITRRGVATGHLTTPGASGELLFVAARSGIVTITVGVPETDAPFVNRGDPAKVRLQALEGKTFEGKVTRTAWALDASTRTLRTEIDLPNPDDLLRPGLYAYATIIAEERKDVLTVPTSALVTVGGRSYCVVIANGRAKRKDVKLGLSERKRTEILSGLDIGDFVVEANAAALEDGQPVEETGAKGSNPKG